MQLSWNYNYGAFARWLYEIGIRDENGEILDLLNYPNMVLTKMDPPLSILGSLWFYMMPGSGIPAMHDVLIGNWAGQGQWTGSVFGPSSKIINNECGGEEAVFPGGFESRRIKAFRYYTQYFGVPVLAAGQSAATLSCKGFEYPVRTG